MSNAQTKAAMNKIAEGIYELADAMFQDAVGAPQTAQEPSPFVDLPDEVFAQSTPNTVIFDPPAPKPQGSLTICPSHKAEYRAGKYGFYCPALSDDPAWANKKGYCTITPDNAAQWLRINAA